MAQAAFRNPERDSLPPKPPPAWAGVGWGGEGGRGEGARALQKVQATSAVLLMKGGPMRGGHQRPVRSPAAPPGAQLPHPLARSPSRLVRTTTLLMGTPSTWLMYFWCLSGHCGTAGSTGWCVLQGLPKIGSPGAEVPKTATNSKCNALRNATP